MGAAKFLRFHSLQLFYFYLFRKQFHPWRATWRHDNWVLPDFYVAISGNYFTFIFSGNIFISEERLDVTTTGCCQTSTLPLLAMIFSENIFIREEQLDVTTTGCCQTSTLPFLAITLLLSFPKTSSSVRSDLTSRQLGAAKLLRCHFWLWSFPKTISSVKSNLTSRQLGAAKLLRCHFWLWSFPKTFSSVKSNLTSRQLGAARLLRCHFWQLLYFYLFRKHLHPWRATWRPDNWVLPNFYVAISGYDLFQKEFRPWRATWRHDNWVLPNFSVAISGNYFTFIFSENNFIREERPDVTLTGCCQISSLPFLANNLLLSFPKTFSSVKSDLTSRQQGAAKLLRWHFTQLLYFYHSRKKNFPWRATWRHAKWVLPNFFVSIPCKYFTFTFSENNFIHEEQLDVTTTGCCQIPTLPFLAITLLLSFPKTISFVKSDLTSRQLGAAKFLRCHFWQLFYFYLFRKQFRRWRATWRHDNWVLPNFYVAISGNYCTFIFSENFFIREERLDVPTTGSCQTSTLPFLAMIFFRKQFHPSRATWRHDNWELPNFYVAISGYDLFRKHFHPWRATWRHDNWVLPDFYVAISGNYFTFIFSGNIFIREQRLDVTTTGCCHTSTLPLLAMIFSENNSIREERLAVTTTGWCQASTLPFLSITLLSSFPKIISSVKSDLTSRQLGAAKLLRCHFTQLLYFYLSRKQFHPWRATWSHDNWELPNF